jgi:serine-type D-Ala-D-Ala carboxypeptidase/endopeptidase (penicillin-binding protein 4)
MGVTNLARAALPRKGLAQVLIAALWSTLVAALSVGVALSAVPVAHAQDATLAALKERLTATARGAGLGERIGISIVDLRTRTSVLNLRAELPLNPASNMKLLTAAASLIELGPEYRLQTGLYGRVTDGVVRGGLCLKGRGDPTLGRDDLMSFAQRAYEEGAREVDEVLIDGTYFDDRVLPPLFEQQPNEIAPFRAAVSALAVKANAYTLRVRPGAREGAPAIVAVDAADYFQIENALLTGPGALSVIADDRPTTEGVLLALSGNIPLGTPSAAYERRVPEPLRFAGQLFADSLRRAGISVAKRVNLSPCPSDLPLIQLQSSPPLAQIIWRLGKDSDNFVAEMLLKVMGAERTHRPGSSSDGAEVVVDIMKQLGVASEGLIVLNGSGLFQGNRVAADQLTGLLTTMYANPAVRDEFVAHLAVGGVDGTLARRFGKLPAKRIVRAKTGTLADVVALSGFVLGPTPERAFAFSYLANGVAGKHGAARALIDQLVDILAQHLYAR